MATESRRFMPPLKVPACLCATSDKRISSSKFMLIDSTDCGGTSLIAAKMRKCSMGVSDSQRMSNWGQTPRCCLMSAMPLGCVTVLSMMTASPLEHGSTPVSTLMSVVLPAPLGPSKAKRLFF